MTSLSARARQVSTMFLVLAGVDLLVRATQDDVNPFICLPHGLLTFVGVRSPEAQQVFDLLAGFASIYYITYEFARIVDPPTTN